MNDYVHELEVLYTQLRYPELRNSAIIGLVIRLGIPIIGILTVVNLLTK